MAVNSEYTQWAVGLSICRLCTHELDQFWDKDILKAKTPHLCSMGW